MRHALILAGGSGTRLWPYSTGDLPKQLVPLFENGRSLLHMAFDRAAALLPRERIWLAAGENYRRAVQDKLPELPPANFLAEPSGRDTLCAIGLACAAIAAKDPDATVVVLTSDHVIEPIPEFAAALEKAFQLAEQKPNRLVTFGITPDHAATGYGYLELGRPVGPGQEVARFKEKPDPKLAQAFFAAGPDYFLWNSGMFIWTARSFLNALDRFAPDHAPILRAMGAAAGTPEFGRLAAAQWDRLKKVSVDYAIMEPASRSSDFEVCAVPLKLRWLDVGAWPAYAETLGKDADRNTRAAAKGLLLESKDCLVASSDPDHVVALVGCEGLVVIHTPHATLVVPKAQAQKVKDAQAEAVKRWA